MISLLGGLWLFKSMFKMVDDAATVKNCRDNLKKSHAEAQVIRNANYMEEAKEEDYYYRPQSRAIFPPNRDFYSDGSLRYDVTTGASYPKGKYYCRSDGFIADSSMAPAHYERPPGRKKNNGM